MNGLLTLVQALATFITGPFGISVITVAVAGSFLAAALHFMRWGQAIMSLVYGGMAFSAAWAVTLFGA